MFAIALVGQQVATAIIYAGVDLGSGDVKVVHLVSSFDGRPRRRFGRCSRHVQNRFDMIGDVATSWQWGST